MKLKDDELKRLLDSEATKRDCVGELCYLRPDPLMVAHRHKDELVSLACALFAYGNAKQIVKFLDSIDFSVNEGSEEQIKKAFASHYYRFQNSEDVTQFFISLRRIKGHGKLEEFFYEGYKKQLDIRDGIASLVHRFRSVNSYYSHGYDFLIGDGGQNGNSPMKRWNMYLRWMVRHDNIDMGLWSKVDKKHLILPLDTHTFKVSQRLGLLERKSYDMRSALLITEKLREFDPQDPVKYDFALYRIGQEKL